MSDLVRYDAMIRAIAECHTVDEVKDIRDKAMALQHYAKMAQNTDAERKACEIRLRAEKQAGSMLAVMEKAKGAAGNPGGQGAKLVPSHGVSTQTLEEMGITHNQSSRWQRLASVPNDQFEAALADPDEMPSTAGIMRKANGGTTKMHPDALWLWGNLRDWERMKLYDNSPEDLLGEMTVTMQTDIKRILPTVIAWLNTLEGEIHE